MIIYQITNTVNGKTYIGKTQKTAEERFCRHVYNHKHQNTHLYKSMRKHGVDKFKISVIEQVDGDINEREKFWISKLNPEYNMTLGGDGGDTSHSENYKRGMKNRIHPHTASYGMLGKQHPMKGKSLEKNKKPVMCEGTFYPSIKEAQQAYPGIKLRYRIDSNKYPEFYRIYSPINQSTYESNQHCLL